MEQCIRLENDIHKSFVNKYITVGVFIDFQKAFDMLWKHGLLQKMVSLNIVSEIGLYETGSLGFLPVLWIGITTECFQYFGSSCENHILLINNKNILSVFSDKCLNILTNPPYLLKISVKSVVLTTTVVSLK
jgi:hypothetical protein